jgi:hypothetical protein
MCKNKIRENKQFHPREMYDIMEIKGERPRKNCSMRILVDTGSAMMGRRMVDGRAYPANGI